MFANLELFNHGLTASAGPGPPHCRCFMLRPTTVGRTPLDE